VRTLTAIAREMLGAGLRILTGALLAIFFAGYALGAVMLLPLVALVLAVAALPAQLRAAGRLLRVADLLLRAAAWSLRRATLTTAVHARAALGWWLSLGGR
jgi:hypothetical protein